MNEVITFKKLAKEHFPLLLKWLEALHVKKWWSKNIKWTPELIEKKYGNYIKGFKRLELATEVIEKPIYAFIITINGVDAGYIQCYDQEDFPPEKGYDTSWIPKGSTAVIDWYIGEPNYLGQGISSEVLNLFLGAFVFKVFDDAFVDPDTRNILAVHVYEKIGFRKLRDVCGVTFMVKNRGW
ncbi:GNAT family N-acetyltransferase [Wolbachia endosymbiont of Folsomia candida]|uniref:GNAT family N-acetyltransferase n=1 Tax=Wolbachia endosymbiont of Folsomia candida TaxID=169402 RepID=UPI000B5F9A2C|nr:GNAT family N-acetyltransferase [Wolbachia endosymbiont of Folsomia candida]APR97736.1 N-acetyltransferase [Wolbachia endosymbiont of Folsomia candida]